ncbi:NADH-ubiquinone oxidoreductase chain C [Rubellimicrobium mesophilum DSM 19309]|uniref:NADH-quinone oxidoreductase subunit C n=1 Tax=Rubellimicrobium mesophilum DSM 19309 TaxID=442562 RepID=A0A017HTT6_9RHOB|nr:NADH-quinone oxidoreductase subunit C [Rubellimicrobium mesophilum]EYD77811.1 NADH-ubiquinone oxidoreductase chain C [Rubellimicrobium mesophilum DSM 19309]
MANTPVADNPAPAEPAQTPEVQVDPLVALGESIAARGKGAILSQAVRNGELTIETGLGSLLETVAFLKADSSCRFAMLIDVTAVDWPGREKRFDLVYHFLSMYTNRRIRLKVQVGEEEMVPSVTSIHPGANWFEREVFDMFGLVFSGHPDMRRILTDYGFRGHPLRKDFPLTGYNEVRYDEVQKRVVYEPVRLTAEWREFDFLSPWEGGAFALPGDEKAGDAKAGLPGSPNINR